MVGGEGADHDRGAGAGEAAIGRVGGGQSLVARSAQGGAEETDAGRQGGIGGQAGLGVAAGEVDGAEVTGGGVALGILGNHRV